MIDLLFSKISYRPTSLFLYVVMAWFTKQPLFFAWRVQSPQSVIQHVLANQQPRTKFESGHF